MKNTLDITTLMKFDQIHGKYGLSEGKQLGRHWIFKSLFAACWKRFNESLETLQLTGKLTAQSLFNHPNWKQMKFGTRIAVGRVLRLYAKQGWLPLQVTNPEATGTKYYVRTLSEVQADEAGNQNVTTPVNPTTEDSSK